MCFFLLTRLSNCHSTSRNGDARPPSLPEPTASICVSAPPRREATPLARGSGYGELTYQGSASIWYTNGVYFEKNGATSQAYNSTQAARFNKTDTRVIYMLQDKPGGAGTISFQGKVWSKESNDCLFTV